MKALGEVTDVVAKLLKADSDVVLGAFAAMYSAYEPWPAAQLHEDQNGVSIDLAAVPGGA